MKRLDDSNDDVRRTICATLATFFQAPAEGAFSSTCVGYMVDTLLIHLDDPEEDMQKAVYGTLLAAIAVAPDLVEKKASKARESHRDPELADDLVARARSAGK